ncbi:hypothetical protein DPMN_028074 [Dreissena polymorpha]|uniref:Uncharacterized protein n=1 Tax=Dreissena polymorpha TaxID=45954 RepID=A0A9D4RE17_DREPO|nr:hypothetical protein DPMN_028074 [Dreissena polymorpha]
MTSAYTASSYQEDLEIQILLDQAEELSSILRGETTQMLHILTEVHFKRDASDLEKMQTILQKIF